jgi:NADPH-ferrihemoprotein reductase
VAVLPENGAAVVAEAAAALGLDPDAAFRLSLPSPNPGGLPEPPAGAVTVRHLLARYADLLSAPGKGALEALAAFASDPGEAARLRQMASISGRDAYHAYVVAPKRSLLELLRDFPSARPSLGAFLGSVAPRLQPRFYSISSSPAAHPRAVHITCAVVEEAMPSGRVHRGVASTYLAAAAPGDTLALFLRRSTFKLPADPAVPVVMVGPGTGLAPFRGFVQERAALAAGGAALGPAALFFGCRHRAHDYIYREELEGAVAGGALSQLSVAFSREGEGKDYVQHHMARQGEALWALLRPQAAGVLYVCGDAKHMAQDVHRTLVDVVRRATGCTAHKAELQVKAMSDAGRYLKDVW